MNSTTFLHPARKSLHYFLAHCQSFTPIVSGITKNIHSPTFWNHAKHSLTYFLEPCKTSTPILSDKKESLHKKAYIDDLTLLENISLSKLIPKTRIIGPPNFHDRFHLKLSEKESILQHQLEDLKQFTKTHSMKINSLKTKCLPFINSRTKDFVPELTLEEGSHLEVIYQLKLVGLVINSEVSWQPHID